MSEEHLALPRGYFKAGSRPAFVPGWMGREQNWYVCGFIFWIFIVFFFIAMEFHDMRNEVSSFFDVGDAAF